MSLSNQEAGQVQSIIGNKTYATNHVEIAENVRSMLQNQIARGDSGRTGPFKIAELSRISGVPESTIRSWKKKIWLHQSSAAGHGPMMMTPINNPMNPSQPSATSSLEPMSEAASLLLGKARQPPERQVRALSTKLGLNVLNPSAPHCAVPLRFGADFFRRC